MILGSCPLNFLIPDIISYLVPFIVQMKKLVFTLLAVVIFQFGFSQNIPPVEGVRLEAPQDYRNADSAVVQVSKYFLKIPIDQDNNTRLTAGVFLVRWIAGTPEFDFDLNSNVFKYIKKDVDLLTVYYSCVASFAIHHPAVNDANTITLNAAKLLVAYINNPANHVVLTRQLKNLVEADAKGDLKSFLKL